MARRRSRAPVCALPFQEGGLGFQGPPLRWRGLHGQGLTDQVVQTVVARQRNRNLLGSRKGHVRRHQDVPACLHEAGEEIARHRLQRAAEAGSDKLSTTRSTA